MAASEDLKKNGSSKPHDDQLSVKDEEAKLEKLPYPKSVFFIVSNEFCERFCYYGMRTILILYLTDILKFTDSDAKIFFHAFVSITYFCPLLGAIVSDSWLGKYRTILYVSMIYAVGCILLALTAVNTLNMPKTSFSILSLMLISLGTGGIKPCVAAFGGDQFIIPGQESQLERFFSWFYFSINAGSLISTFLTPVLRNDVHCFGQNSCFSLAFAVPGVLMIVSICIFALGRPMYIDQKPKGNVFVRVVKCMTYALTHRKAPNPGNHWLDRSEQKFGAKLVNDIKILLKVLIVYIPLPIFWTLYDQQGSAWTLQAVRMNGDIGFYTILPDQMQVINPLLILGFIPIFTYWIYPLLAKMRLVRTPLQKMVGGGFLAVVAFAISAIMWMAIESTDPTLPSKGEAQVRLYDTTNCQYSFTTTNNVIPGAPINFYYAVSSVKIPQAGQTVSFTFTPKASSASCKTHNFDVIMNGKTSYGVFLNEAGPGYYEDAIDKSDDGFPFVRTLAYDNTTDITYTYLKKGEKVMIPAGNLTLFNMGYVGKFKIDVVDKEVEFLLGGVYTVLINKEQNFDKLIEVSQPNTIHMLTLIPQIIVITAAEIMFSITGLEFAYSQAPVSMKSVLQALFLLTTAIGDLIIVAIESAKMFDKASNDSWLYTVLMVADMLVFMWLAIRYKYIHPDEISDASSASYSPKKRLSSASYKSDGLPALQIGGRDNKGYSRN